MIRAVIFDYFGVVFRDSRNDPRMLELILKLRMRGYKTGLLSNTSLNALEGHLPDYAEYFDEVVLSQEIGVAKPAEKIYRLVAEKMKVAMEECIFVDDSLTNVLGAMEAGMKGVLYEGFGVLLVEIEKHGVRDIVEEK